MFLLCKLYKQFIIMTIEKVVVCKADSNKLFSVIVCGINGSWIILMQIKYDYFVHPLL